MTCPCKGCITFALCRNNVLGPIERFIYHKYNKANIYRTSNKNEILCAIFCNIILPPFITPKCKLLIEYLCNRYNDGVIDTERIEEFITLIGVDYKRCRKELTKREITPIELKYLRSISY